MILFIKLAPANLICNFIYIASLCIGNDKALLLSLFSLLYLPCNTFIHFNRIKNERSFTTVQTTIFN